MISRSRENNKESVDVTYCYDYRGKHDDELTFMFKGATSSMLECVFKFLCGGGRGIADGFKILYDHDPIRRAGCVYHRLCVTLINRHERFATLDSIMLLIQARLKALTSGKILPTTINQFMNA